MLGEVEWVGKGGISGGLKQVKVEYQRKQNGSTLDRYAVGDTVW